jgi:translocation protein SEC62
MMRKTDPNAKDQWDPALVPLIKLITSKKGLRTKQAAEVRKKKVTYFRAKDCTWLTEHADLLKRKCGKALAEHCGSKDHTVEGEKDIETLISALVHKGFIYPTKYSPIEQSTAATKTKKWPDRLVAVQPQPGVSAWAEDYFYCIAYEGDPTMQYVLLGVLIVVILMACMFPAWPLWAKLGVWYLATALLALMLFIVVLRIVVFVLFWVVGFDFWIFPNFFDEYAGVLDSFLPFYTFERRLDSWRELMVRAVVGAMLAAAIEQISHEHSFDDFYDFGKTALLDFVQWGEDNFILGLAAAPAVPTLTQLQEELKDLEDDGLDDAVETSDAQEGEDAEDLPEAEAIPEL